ncbi:MAG TPA: hypothetical protein VMC82_06835 [Thermoplasmata archaeon]|nr:hypothetical protein [Thermoplasmata archaeon]
MRAGLFAVGTAVAIVGAGVLIASFTFSTGPTRMNFDPIAVSNLAGHSSYTPQLAGTNDSSASTHLVWSATTSLLVTVFPSVPCPGSTTKSCASGHAIASWWESSGSWSASGPLSFPLFLNITNPNATPATFSGSLIETYTTSALSDPTWGFFLPVLGAVVLIAIGGVGIFLGIFLPQGIYSGARGPPAEFDDPELDEFDDEEEPPPPEGGGAD